jgi:peptidoglycan/LPS O-acetylase OafA/YrhL
MGIEGDDGHHPMEDPMLAIVAAVIFGFALLLDFMNSNLGAPDLFNWNTLVLIGLICLALYLAGVGRGPATGGGRWYRGRRPGRG